MQPVSEPVFDEQYLRLRAGLIRLFAAQGLSDPEGLADETIRRVLDARQREELRSEAAFATRVALNLAKEERRRLARERAAGLLPLHDEPSMTEEAAARLAVCLGRLEPRERQLVERYYELDGNAKIRRHQAMARKLGITQEALVMRIRRIREKLGKCLKSLDGAEGPTGGA